MPKINFYTLLNTNITYKYLKDLNFSNHMVIGPAITQGYFYNPFVPSYLKFGSIGAVLGHEMMHSFDPYGITLGINGS